MAFYVSASAMKCLRELVVLLCCNGFLLAAQGHVQEQLTGSFPPPTADGGPREVSVSMYILNMHPVDDADMHLTLQMYLRAQWKEPRLNVSWEGKNPGDAYLHIPPQRFDELPWHPDLFIVNGISIESPKLFTDPIFIRVMGDNETILVSRLIVVKIPCTMDFRDYPLDEQRCSISLESYAHEASQLRLNWMANDAVKFENGINLGNHDWKIEQKPSRTIVLSSANYTALPVEITLIRWVGNHLVQTFVPSILFVMISWLSFLIPMEHSSSRMLLCIGGVLGVTVFYGAIQQSLPGVSYVRSIDAWLLTCLILTMVPFLVFVLQSIWGTTMGYTVQSESGSVAAEPSPRRHNIIVAGRWDLDSLAFKVYGVVIVLFIFIFWIRFV